MDINAQNQRPVASVSVQDKEYFLLPQKSNTPGRRPPRHPARGRPAGAGKPGGKPAPRPEVTHSDKGEHRIAKLLARAGVASRREIERMIAEGRIALN